MNQDPYELLKAKYIATMPVKIADLNESWDQLVQCHWEQAKLDHLTLLAHRLSGSGGSYGFPEISQLSSELEHSILQYVANPTDIQLKDEMADLLQKLVAYLTSLSK